MNNDTLRQVLATVAATPGATRTDLRALCADLSDDDFGASLRMLGSCRSIAYVFDSTQGVDGFYPWDKAPRISLEMKRIMNSAHA